MKSHSSIVYYLLLIYCNSMYLILLEILIDISFESSGTSVDESIPFSDSDSEPFSIREADFITTPTPRRRDSTSIIPEIFHRYWEEAFMEEEHPLKVDCSEGEVASWIRNNYKPLGLDGDMLQKEKKEAIKYLFR